MNLNAITSTLLLVLIITLSMACKNDDDGGNNNLASCCEQAPLLTEFDGAKVFIPNVFTPNFDGNNDILFVFGGENLEKVNSFQIFDGANMVFERNDFLSNDPMQGWDGRISGNSVGEDGIYTYKVTLTSGTTNETASFEGVVCLRAEDGPDNSNPPCLDFESQCRYGLQHDGNGGVDLTLDPNEYCN